MGNNILSLPRLSKYAAAYIYNTRRQLLALIAIMFGLTLLFTLTVPKLSDCYNIPSYIPGVDRMWGVEMNFFKGMLLAFAAVCAARMFGIYAGKSGKIRNLMFPASEIEKFLTYFFIYIVGFYIVFIISTFFADFIRVLVYRHTSVANATVSTIPIKYILTNGWSEIVTHTNFSGAEIMRIHIYNFNSFMNLVLIVQAFFALGSSIWQKNTILKTGLAGIIILIVCFILLALGIEVFFSNYLQMKYRFNWGEIETIMAIIDIFVIGITLFMYWLSFLRFKEMEVINRW